MIKHLARYVAAALRGRFYPVLTVYALTLAPDYAGAMSNLGAALVPSQPAEAIRLLEKAVARQPAYVRAQYNLALAYAQTNGDKGRTAKLLGLSHQGLLNKLKRYGLRP